MKKSIGKKLAAIIILVISLCIFSSCGEQWSCDECGKQFSGKAYYGAFGDEVLCEDCARSYWAPFPYEDYERTDKPVRSASFATSSEVKHDSVPEKTESRNDRSTDRADAKGVVGRVLKYLREGDVENARKVYAKRIKDNADKKSELRRVLESAMDELNEGFDEGKVSFEEVRILIESVDKFDNGNGYFDVSSQLLTMNMLADSKDAYEKAEHCMEKEDYISAIEYYQNVCLGSLMASAQEKAEEAKKLFVKTEIEAARKLAESGEHSDALNKLYAAEDILSNRCECVTEYDMYAFVEEADRIIAEYCDSVIARADELYAQEHDALKAIELLESAQMEYYYIPLENVITEYYAKFEDDTIQEAEDVFAETGDYEKAIAILHSALGMIGENARLLTEIEMYGEYAPVALTSLKYTKKTKYVDVGTDREDIYMDVCENIYERTSVISRAVDTWASASDGPDSEDESYVSYNLNCKYKILSGVVYRPYNSLSYDGAEIKKSTTVKIYGDGVLLYEAPDMNPKTFDPVLFEIDVSGVHILTINILGTWKTSSEFYGIYEVYPRVCLAEVYLKK